MAHIYVFTDSTNIPIVKKKIRQKGIKAETNYLLLSRHLGVIKRRPGFFHFLYQFDINNKDTNSFYIIFVI